MNILTRKSAVGCAEQSEAHRSRELIFSTNTSRKLAHPSFRA